MGPENALRRRGFGRVAGVDEAGRGPLAGPVVAAAVILPPRLRLPGLDDSKKVAPAVRERLFERLTSHPLVEWSCAVVDVEVIERIDILRASWLAMAEAVAGLGTLPDIALVDGSGAQGLPVPHESLVGGDGLSRSIAAASIIAKVERDRLMCRLAERFPHYGFERHKGYGTRDHLAALRRHGPSPIHRKTFQPVAQLVLDLEGA